MDEQRVHDFWQQHPCGDFQVGGLDSYAQDYEAFFRDYDAFRYDREGHILQCLDGIDFRGMRVLEIGLGEGADSEQIIRRGGKWSGVDLTAESVNRVRTRLTLRKLPYEDLKQGSVLQLPFADDQFDIVFSHGVLHHVPDIKTAQREIHRVLKPTGELIAMLYARWSINYLLAIGIVRRLGLLGMIALRPQQGGRAGQHLINAKKAGLWRYLRMDNFVHTNTDGPLNPYSKVYDLSAVAADFPAFDLTRSYRRFMYAPPVPVRFLPLEHWLGWHLWVHLRPKAKASA